MVKVDCEKYLIIYCAYYQGHLVNKFIFLFHLQFFIHFLKAEV